MIDFDTFKKTIKIIKDYDEKDQKLHDLVGEGIGTYSCNIISVVIELLSKHLDNDDCWLSWWIWECNYGTEHCLYNEKDSDEDIDLSDIRVFYDFLVSLKKKDN